MDRLRALCFPGSDPARSSRDEFDSRSIYVVNEIHGELAAYGRLTPGPRAVFETWSRGIAEIPTGPNIADLGRCMIAPAYRGLDLITLICLDGLLLAAEMGFERVVGAVVPGRKLSAMLHEIGFRNSGRIVQSYEENGAIFTLQPF
jgi:predicted GNAT family N-acyltransferase